MIPESGIVILLFLGSRNTKIKQALSEAAKYRGPYPYRYSRRLTTLHPSSMSFSRAGRAGLSSYSYSLLSDLNTQSSLILRSYKHVRYSISRADLSSQSPVVLYRSPLLSTSLSVARIKLRLWA